MKVRSAWLVVPSPIANVTMAALNAEKDKRLDMEYLPQGLLVTVKGHPFPVLVGHANVKSVELYADPRVAGGSDEAPPVDNEHVAEGCEPFSPETVAAAARAKGGKGRGKKAEAEPAP